MSGMFCFKSMFRPHIKNSNLKMPENFDEYNPEEYPHFHVFMLMHLARPIDITALESNANIIAGISEEDIKTGLAKLISICNYLESQATGHL